MLNGVEIRGKRGPWLDVDIVLLQELSGDPGYMRAGIVLFVLLNNATIGESFIFTIWYILNTSNLLSAWLTVNRDSLVNKIRFQSALLKFRWCRAHNSLAVLWCWVIIWPVYWRHALIGWTSPGFKIHVHWTCSNYTDKASQAIKQGRF